MLNKIIQWSIKNRLIVVIGAAVLLVYGGIVALRAPVDVFPDLTAPTVTILTESHGMAPEEVEALVSLPIEASMNGTAGVFRVRSNSAAGISIVASVSAPSSLAMEFARDSNQTLVGFLRPPSFNIYSHVERVILD